MLDLVLGYVRFGWLFWCLLLDGGFDVGFAVMVFMVCCLVVGVVGIL